MTREEAKLKITELVDKYKSLSSAQVKAFNEANTKQSFIEPLFKALGWDVDDNNEVALEEKASSGRVDYAFKLHGVSQFYLEAKPLKADLNNPEYIKQAITYAYNKGVTWVVLTDFEGLRLFNALSNKSFVTLQCQDYLSAFDKLWLLSRESLAEGLLNKEAAQSGALPSTLLVEKRLFRQLSQWREDLFNQLHLYNKELTFSQIDAVIQKLFDRLIFIRTCEDRGIEEKRLLAALNQWKTDRRKGELVETIRIIFREFDGYYDSDLFAHHTIDSVFIMATTLEQIITGLYEIPGGMASYDFSIIDADVLGAVYEQYLGHVAQVVKQREKEAQAKMDLGIQTESIILTAKAQRRKEQGIYYTPKFVTDYIVKETVGRFIKEHTPNEIHNIKVLDPACGSGSFLIRAYDELLNYHASERSKPIAELDQWERLPILTGNIFGVDLDIQAIEIASLNLLLRSLARRDILPSLKENIRQGNSLIFDTDEELKKYFGDNWREKSPFDWEGEFKDIIMAQGGFDVIIGNPPYVRFGSLPEQERNYHRDYYKSAFKQYDIYVLFIEKAIGILKNGGRLGFITSSKFFASDYGEKIRKYVLDTCCIEKVVDVSTLPVFKDVAIYPFIFILRKEGVAEKRKDSIAEVVTDLSTEEEFRELNQVTRPIKQAKFLLTIKNLFDISDIPTNILDKIESKSVTLGSVFKITRGFRPPPDELLITEENYRKLAKKARADYGKFVMAKDITGPYAINWGGLYLKYEQDKIAEAKPSEVFDNPKIMLPDISYHPKAYYDREGLFCLKTVYLILKDKPTKYNLFYITGILNSNLIDFFFRKRFSAMHMGGDYLRFRKQYIEQIPIRLIDFDNSIEKKLYDKLVALTEKMMELNIRLAPISDSYSNESDGLKREIERTDKEIDNLVYDLYGLTETERKIVEDNV